jgi:hypothetical protein
MKSLILALVSALSLSLNLATAGVTPVFPNCGNTEEVDTDEVWSTSFSSHYFSKYVYNGAVYHDAGVLQSDVTITSPYGLSLNIWWSTDMKGAHSWGDEVDYTLTYAKSFDAFDLELSVAYFDCFKLFKKEGDAFDFTANFSKEIELSEEQTITPFVELNYYIPLEDNPGGFDGLVMEVGVEHSIELWSEYVTLKQQLSLIHDNGAFNCDSGNILKYQASLEYEANNCLTFDVGIQYYKMLSSFSGDSRGTDGDQFIWFAGATLSF